MYSNKGESSSSKFFRQCTQAEQGHIHPESLNYTAFDTWILTMAGCCVLMKSVLSLYRLRAKYPRTWACNLTMNGWLDLKSSSRSWAAVTRETVAWKLHFMNKVRNTLPPPKKKRERPGLLLFASFFKLPMMIKN